MSVFDRLTEDQDFYVRVQKTKLLVVLIGVLCLIVKHFW